MILNGYFYAVEKEYDVIIIGTSPLAIAEAVYQKTQGKSVLNIDQHDEVGGAWTTIKYDNLPEIEIGCHIWEIQKETTDFLQRFYGLSLTPLTPQPRIIKKSFSIPYDWKVNLSTTKLIVKRTAKLKFGLLRQELKSPHNRFTLFPDKYLYPRLGSRALKIAVEKKIDKHGLSLQLGASVIEFQLGKEKELVKVILKSGEVLMTKQLVTTSVTEIERVKIGEDIVCPKEAKRMDYIHVHLILKGGMKKKFSYFRFMDDPLIHRVSDMTFQVADQLGENDRLICVGVHERSYYKHDDDSLIKEVLTSLISHGLFTDQVEVKAFNKNVFPTYYGHRNMLEDLAKEYPERLQVLRSSNFIYSFYNHLEKYRSLLSTSGK
ncbi:MAG: hypothetical protein MK066_02455 [Crocinitomicaceae bacterium]|nr:hypothetical protein [Crocinitomicaceae bacterium]